ncbi:hypothetical protein CsatB_006641 [Cannabis sativa]
MGSYLKISFTTIVFTLFLVSFTVKGDQSDVKNFGLKHRKNLLIWEQKRTVPTGPNHEQSPHSSGENRLEDEQDFFLTKDEDQENFVSTRPISTHFSKSTRNIDSTFIKNK